MTPIYDGLVAERGFDPGRHQATVIRVAERIVEYFHLTGAGSSQ